MTDVPSDADLRALALRVAAGLQSRRQLLVSAESCTGGWLGKVCTELPGSSEWYAGGAIVYSNELKQRVLGVRPGTLQAEGAVSEAVVREMAEGALQHLKGDVSVAITGIAGPEGGSIEKPVGTVYFGIGDRDETVSSVSHFSGNRHSIQILAAHTGLNLLRLHLLRKNSS